MFSMAILGQYTSTVKRFITNHNSRNGLHMGNFEPQEIRSGKWKDSNGAKSKDVEIFEPIDRRRKSGLGACLRRAEEASNEMHECQQGIFAQ
jgi:hypothetical protein